jgi:hypothetical protein
MKNTFWVVVVVTAVFLGFMLGYSFPPFLEIGFAVGKGKKAPPTKIDKKLENYYKDLYKEE